MGEPVAPIAELVDVFCKTNDLSEPTEGWHHNLFHPPERN